METDCIAARLQHTTLDWEDWLLVMGKQVLVLDALRVLDGSWGVIVSCFSPVPRECALLLALKFNFDARRQCWLHNVEINLAVNSISGLVEGEFSLNLNTALRIMRSGIAEEKHLLIL